MKVLTLPFLLAALLGAAACQSLTTMGERPTVTWTGEVPSDTVRTTSPLPRPRPTIPPPSDATDVVNDPADFPDDEPVVASDDAGNDPEDGWDEPWEDAGGTDEVADEMPPDEIPPDEPAPVVTGRLDRLNVETRQSLSALPAPLTGENKLGGTALRFRRSIPNDTPEFVPRTRDGLDLVIADASSDGWFAFYKGECGGLGDVCRYRAVLFDRTGAERWDLDLNRFLMQDEQVEIQDARLHDGRVYFNAACATYAAETGGDCSQLIRVDPEWREAEWRTSPLVSNNIFIFQDPFVVAGYGFTAEPDSLYLIDQQTGRIAARAGLDSAHEYLEIHDGTLYVVTYRSVYTFDL